MTPQQSARAPIAMMFCMMALFSSAARGNGADQARADSASAPDEWLSLVFQGDLEAVAIVDPLKRRADLDSSEIPGCEVWREPVIAEAEEEIPPPIVIMAYVPGPVAGNYKIIASGRDSTLLIVSVRGHIWGRSSCGASLTQPLRKSEEISRSVLYTSVRKDSCSIEVLKN